MTYVVFTGRCVDRLGQFICRNRLKVLARQQGFIVRPSIEAGTGILVASRTDTSKARDARRLGVGVITYATFLEALPWCRDHYRHQGGRRPTDPLPEIIARATIRREPVRPILLVRAEDSMVPEPQPEQRRPPAPPARQPSPYTVTGRKMVFDDE